MNTHRGVIYEQRDMVLGGSNIRENVQEMLEKELTAILDGYLQRGQPDNWDVEGLIAELATILPLDEKLSDPDAVFEMPADSIYDEVLALANSRYDRMEELFTPDMMRTIERAIMLRVIDSHWVQHLTSMENLRQGIGLYSYGQRDPLVMYKTKGFEQFQTLSERIQSDVARMIFHVQDAGPTQQRGRSRRNGPSNGGASSRQIRSVPKSRPRRTKRGIEREKTLSAPNAAPSSAWKRRRTRDVSVTDAIPTGPAIEVRGASKAYGRSIALNNLDLSVPWGQALTVFGPNGSGKTTLIKVLATLSKPDAGTITIAGLDARRDGSHARRLIGVMTHDPLLYDDLTARENLRFAARMFGLKDPSERIEDISDQLDIAARLDQRVGDALTWLEEALLARSRPDSRPADPAHGRAGERP